MDFACKAFEHLIYVSVDKMLHFKFLLLSNGLDTICLDIYNLSVNSSVAKYVDKTIPRVYLLERVMFSCRVGTVCFICGFSRTQTVNNSNIFSSEGFSGQIFLSSNLHVLLKANVWFSTLSIQMNKK